MSWVESIDIYCERTSVAFWAEPINAVTNLAFILASAFAFRLLRKDIPTKKTADLQFLILMIALIGVGSFLFHTYAQRWALYADVIPIAICLHAYVLVFVRRVMRCSILISVAWLGVYIGVGFLTSYLFDPRALNGSISYMPSFAALGLMAVYSLSKKITVARVYLCALLVFGLSLTFRTIDMGVCEELEVGTHFMWHVLNALALYLAMKALIKNEKYKQIL